MTRPASLVLFFILPWLAAAAPASLVSLEGEVTVSRGGVVIPSEKLSDGFLLEAFDTISTGTTGKADVRFTPSIGLSGSLRLDSDTSLYLELTTLKKEQLVGVELLTGSVSVSLSAVAGSSALEVRTDSGTYTGTGPQFRLVETSWGDVLATTKAGKVLCRVGNRTVYAEPGSVVEVLNLDRSVQTYTVNVSTLDSYETTWARQRQQVFRDQSAVAFRTAASRYQLQGGLFQRAWDRVQRESQEDPRGAAVANLRRAAGPLERSLFQIKALRKLFDDGTLSPSLELTRGYAAKDFFRQATQDEVVWMPRLLEARAFYRALADKNGGSFPRAAGVAITWNSDFFQ